MNSNSWTSTVTLAFQLGGNFPAKKFFRDASLELEISKDIGGTPKNGSRTIEFPWSE